MIPQSFYLFDKEDIEIENKYFTVQKFIKKRFHNLDQCSKFYLFHTFFVLTTAQIYVILA